jgi:DNA-binding transcriptional ArsR family regulator
MAEAENNFDSSRAELFEALGHPTRVKILRSLEARPMSFSEIKKEVGIESSGHLQFHLGKLSGLIRADSLGNYTLTDDGRGALHVAETALRSEAPLGWKGGIPARFVVGIVAVAIVWAAIMVATSIELSGTEFNTLVVILGGGFIACLLIMARLGQLSSGY